MLELEKNSFAGRWYAFYKYLGGNAHDPKYETLGRFMRKLLLWTWFRWMFYHNVGTLKVAWVAALLWALMMPRMWAYAALVGVSVLLLSDISGYIQAIATYYETKRSVNVPINSNKAYIKLK